jgi:hypothetical protein
MARVLLVADPLFAATADNDAPEARSGQTSDDTLSAPEPHRARGHGLDLLRPHAEKIMLKLETETEMMPAQPRSDASYAPEQAQVEEQIVPQSRDPGHARQQTQSLAQQQSQQQLLLLTQLQQTGSDAAAASAQPQLGGAHAPEQAWELAAAQLPVPAHAVHLQMQHPALQQPQQQTLPQAAHTDATAAGGEKRGRGERGGRGRKKSGEKQARTEGAAGSSTDPAVIESATTATSLATVDAAHHEHATHVAGLRGEPKRGDRGSYGDDRMPRLWHRARHRRANGRHGRRRGGEGTYGRGGHASERTSERDERAASAAGGCDERVTWSST